MEIRAHFAAHMKNMFQLAGDPADAAAAKAAMVLDFETILARASVDRVSLRDPDKRYHIMTKRGAEGADARTSTGTGYFQGVGRAGVSTPSTSAGPISSSRSR